MADPHDKMSKGSSFKESVMNEKEYVAKRLAEGASKAQIARELEVPRSTLVDRIDRWRREDEEFGRAEAEDFVPPKEQVEADRKLSLIHI